MTIANANLHEHDQIHETLAGPSPPPPSSDLDILIFQLVYNNTLTADLDSSISCEPGRDSIIIVLEASISSSERWRMCDQELSI